MGSRCFNGTIEGLMLYSDELERDPKRLRGRDWEYELTVFFAELFTLQLKLHQEWDLDQDEWLIKPFSTLP